ncbi:MAG: hypothetical protein QM533_01840 [Cytophagales bacterium]|nr:hypothetical protein [Cytophagales bacterium]
MSESIHFSIKYDGPALANHQMDLRELAPALIALSNLLEEANKTAFADASEVRVHVQGNFKGGSFGVDLIAIQGITQQIVSIFSGAEATATANLFAILSGLGLLGAGGLIGVIKWLKGRKPSMIRTEGDKAIFELRLSESIETFETDLVTGKLYQNRIVRQALAKVLRPLEREGVDIFATGRDGKTEVVVEKADVASFEMAASEADVVSDTLSSGVLLQIESPVFKDDNKWRFSDGAASFFAEVADKQFLKRVNAGEERFGKGDVLLVDLRRIQTITDNGLKLEYIIAKVNEHRAPLQIRLV